MEERVRVRVRWAIAAAVLTLAMSGGRDLSLEAHRSPGQTTWADQDIGNPAIAGSASEMPSGFTITAAGSDVWGASDQFHFVYQPVSGDVDLRARVDSLSYSSSWAKAGVMIRASLAPGAAHGFGLVSAGRAAA